MLEIILLGMQEISPYLQNNRAHNEQQIERIANSIKSFGFNQPVVLDEENIIIVGHGRFLAAQKLGMTQIPCVIKTGLSETDKRAYRILDNKLQNDSTWEFDNLKNELDFLVENEFDVSAWGLSDLAALMPEEEPEPSEDNFESIDGETGSLIKRGDIVKLGAHTLFCGDCSFSESFAELMGKVSASILITDPPYGVSYVGKTADALTIDNDDLDERELATFWEACLENCLAHLIDGGAVYLSVPPGPIGDVFSTSLKSRGILRQSLVWVKNSLVLGHSDYHYKHEPVLYGWKPGAAHYFTDDRTQTSVIEVDRPTRSTEHPTMKPVALWSKFIINSSRRGDIVLDPFCGSGTTIIACAQLGRVCYGMEISPVYCGSIIDRYKKYCAESKVECRVTINGEELR